MPGDSDAGGPSTTLGDTMAYAGLNGTDKETVIKVKWIVQSHTTWDKHMSSNTGNAHCITLLNIPNIFSLF